MTQAESRYDPRAVSGETASIKDTSQRQPCNQVRNFYYFYAKQDENITWIVSSNKHKNSNYLLINCVIQNTTQIQYIYKILSVCI